uniref:Related to isoamyl alcohol oxidase n=1 Tax=Neurospora crassa TaxID=5141 RepID=Q6MWP9_NEUCS|nr:related to isoamyl alcohol oxidase [Neurospora crassa]
MMWQTSLGAAAAVFSLLTSQVVGQEDIQTEAQTAQIESTKGVILDSILDWNDAARLDPTTYNGQKYGCKCYPGRPCWPSANKWNSLNRTVDGTLRVNVPAGAVCHNTFDGPFGTIQTYDEAACADAKENLVNEQWTVEKPADGLWTYFTNDTCRPTSNPSDPCTLGSYGVYVIMATKASHIQAGVNFARRNNLRLIVRNTGHDFLGRSVGYGSLIINTHSFQSLKWTDKYTGPGSYRGPAVTMGAGVQGGDILKAGHALNPPMALVTGECATVGLSGGLCHPRRRPRPLDDSQGTGRRQCAQLESDHRLGRGRHVEPKIFHKYANHHFVDNGLYVYTYFEIFPGQFRVRPFVAIGKDQFQLENILRPICSMSSLLPVSRTKAAFTEFPHIAEKAGQTALTGGWMFNHDAVANRNDEIITAMKNVVSPAGRPDLFGGMVGHLFNPGAQRFRFDSGGSSGVEERDGLCDCCFAEPGASQPGGLRNASRSGATYVNEPNWQSHFWGSNYPRLKQLRKKWDPLGVFYAVSTPGTENWEEIEFNTRLCKKL